MKHEIDLPDLPDGFEYTGEFRKAYCGEYYMAGGLICECLPVNGTTESYPIIRKTAPASLLSRIVQEYGDFEVVELKWIDDRLEIDRNGDDCYHAAAQSMKGFYRYVYEARLMINPFCNTHGHPIAALFTKDLK